MYIQLALEIYTRHIIFCSAAYLSLFPCPAQLSMLEYVNMTPSTNDKKKSEQKAEFQVLFNELQVQRMVCLTVAPH